MPTITLNVPETLWNQLQSYRQRRGAALGIPVIDEPLAIQQLLLCGLAGQANLAGQADPAAPAERAGLGGQTGWAGAPCPVGQAVPTGLPNQAIDAAVELEWAAKRSGQAGPISQRITTTRESVNDSQVGVGDQHAGRRRPHFAAAKSLRESGSNLNAGHGSCSIERS